MARYGGMRPKKKSSSGGSTKVCHPRGRGRGGALPASETPAGHPRQGTHGATHLAQGPLLTWPSHYETHVTPWSCAGEASSRRHCALGQSPVAETARQPLFKLHMHAQQHLARVGRPEAAALWVREQGRHIHEWPGSPNPPPKNTRLKITPSPRSTSSLTRLTGRWPSRASILPIPWSQRKTYRGWSPSLSPRRCRRGASRTWAATATYDDAAVVSGRGSAAASA